MQHIRINDDDPSYPLLLADQNAEDDYPRLEDVPQREARAVPWGLMSSAVSKRAKELITILLILWLGLSDALLIPARRSANSLFGKTIAAANRWHWPVFNKAQLWGAASAIGRRMKYHLTSPEFWLGVLFGIVTRAATRIAIQTTFAPTHGYSALIVGFLACAVAGVAAGIVTHLVRARYRNSKIAQAAEREKYWSKALLESAIIGMLGGFIGGCATNVGAVISQAGSFSVGATSGVVASLVHAGSKGYKTHRTLRPEAGWNKLAFQSVAFGAAGGVFGVVFTDVFSAQSSIAASLAESGSTIHVPPPASPQTSFTITPQTPPALEPVQTVVVAMPQSSPPQLSTPPTMSHSEPLAPVQKEPCAPVHHKIHHHKAHHKIHHVKSVARAEPIVPLVREAPVIPLPMTPLPPPPIYVLPAPPPADPCASGLCAPSCDQSSQLEIKGQCSDPNVPCVERVSFNENGEAKSVVLERSASYITKPRYEFKPIQTAENTNWNKAAQSTVRTDQVSFVVPFKNPAGQLAPMEPMPA